MAVLEILCNDDKLYELDDGLWRRLSKCGIDLYDRIICVFETVGIRGFSSMGVRHRLNQSFCLLLTIYIVAYCHPVLSMPRWYKNSTDWYVVHPRRPQQVFSARWTIRKLRKTAEGDLRLCF
jgi:hypothetical protein